MGPEQVPPRVQEAMARLQWQTNGETVEPARDAIDEAVDWYAADLLNQLHTYLLQVRADLIDRLQERPGATRPPCARLPGRPLRIARIPDDLPGQR